MVAPPVAQMLGLLRTIYIVHYQLKAASFTYRPNYTTITRDLVVWCEWVPPNACQTDTREEVSQAPVDDVIRPIKAMDLIGHIRAPTRENTVGKGKRVLTGINANLERGVVFQDTISPPFQSQPPPTLFAKPTSLFSIRL